MRLTSGFMFLYSFPFNVKLNELLKNPEKIKIIRYWLQLKIKRIIKEFEKIEKILISLNSMMLKRKYMKQRVAQQQYKDLFQVYLLVDNCWNKIPFHDCWDTFMAYLLNSFRMLSSFVKSWKLPSKRHKPALRRDKDS